MAASDILGVELSNDRRIADALANLYVSYRQRFNIIKPGGLIFLPKKQGNPLALRNGHLMNHVRRRYAIAVFAGERSSKFLCFDVDTQDAQLVQNLLRELEKLGIPRDMLHVSTSGGKGYHVDLFFDELMYTKDLKTLYLHLVSRVNMEHVEFRPTHRQSIKLPLSAHGKTGAMCWYLDRDT